MTALMVAAATPVLPAAEELLRLGADVSLQDRDGMTPLSHAVQGPESAREVLALLVEAGASVDVRMAREMTPLMDASLRGSDWAVKALLEAGADVRARDFIGWTPLHFAAKGRGAKCAEALIAAGAATDVPDDGGTTPLMVAAASDNPEVVKALLASGADPSRTDRTGRSALGYAVIKNARQCIPLFDAKK